MRKNVKGQRLGGNPLSFLISEKTNKENSSNIIKNNITGQKIRKECIHLKYSEEHNQHCCVSTRSRQSGFLGKSWREKCKKCYVKETSQEEVVELPIKVLSKVFGIH